MPIRRRLLPLHFALAATGLACGAPPQTTPSRASALPRLDTVAALRWTRTSSEHALLIAEVFRLASMQLDRRVATTSGPWAVVLDADETLLDNSPYEAQQAAKGAGYDSVAWQRWAESARAAALPGAVAFTQHVHELGGRAIVITNRADNVCAQTRRNLDSLGFKPDAVMCAPPGVSDKNPRFESVQRGAGRFPALSVVMWVGDNIKDFPHHAPEGAHPADSTVAEIGRSFILLPNPMYGSWSGNRLP